MKWMGKVVLLLLVIIMATITTLIGATPVNADDPITLNIRAYIDGRSLLIIKENTVQWHHLDWAAPGRHEFVDLPTVLNGVEWYHQWPDVPDAENRWCDCYSSLYENLAPALPIVDMSIQLSVIEGRHSISIYQHPAAGNAYTLIIDFNNNPMGGASWYECELTIYVPPSDFYLLVDGVTEIVAPGVPGPVCAMDTKWVPIVAGDEDTSRPSVYAMARTYESGRVVIIGHEGIIWSDNIYLLDNLLFITNVISWLDAVGGKKVMASSGHGEWVPFGGLMPLKMELESRGYTFNEAAAPIDNVLLSDCDVLIFGNAWGSINDTEIDAIESFVSNGGGLLMLGLGWSWDAYHPSSTMEDYPMMKLSAPYGAHWLTHYIVDPTNQSPDASAIFHVFYPDIVEDHLCPYLLPPSPPSVPPPPSLEVGGEVYAVNELIILAPWITLAAVIIAGAILAVRRRRDRELNID